jgi:hypothetical protein
MISAFAHLLDRLPLAKGDEARQRLLAAYLDEEDRGYALAALIGALALPRLSTRGLQKLARDRIDPEYLELSREHVGGLRETVALLWPQQDVGDLSLSEIASADRSDLAADWLDRLDNDGRRCLLSLLSGRVRVVEPAEVRMVLARYFGHDLAEIEAIWASQPPPYDALFAWLEGRGERPRAGPASYRPWPDLIDAAYDDLRNEPDLRWHWARSGRAAALVVESGVDRLYGRGGDDIGPDYRELLALDLEPGHGRGDLVTTDELRLHLHEWTNDDWFRHPAITPAPLFVPDTEPPDNADAILKVVGNGAAWHRAMIPAQKAVAALLYAEAGEDGCFVCTIGLRQGDDLHPVGKAGYVPVDQGFADWVRKNTLERFGPVRRVPAVPVAITHRGRDKAPRRRAGITLRDAKIESVLWTHALDHVDEI